MLPDIIAALFVHAVVGEMHECVLNALWSLVILDCGKPGERERETVFVCARIRKLDSPSNSFIVYRSAMMTIFTRLTLDWVIGALGREISVWQRLRGVDATCAIMRIPWHALCVPEYQHNPKGMSRDRGGNQKLVVIICAQFDNYSKQEGSSTLVF